MSGPVAYDEFSMFHENAAEYGIPFRPPTVRRKSVDTGDGRRMSALVWGASAPEFVFLHGGAQNAHTWDTVLLALDRPAVAVDLPGHGHSDGGRAPFPNPRDSADDLAPVIAALAPDAKTVVGMSLGGLTALALAETHPHLVRRLVLVDITPGVDGRKSAAITAFVNGPESFPDFDAILARTVEHNPTRSVASLRRGILHNAMQRPDGSWVWRYARHRGAGGAGGVGGVGGVGVAGGDPESRYREFNRLWEVLSGLSMPVMLVRGMTAQSVVDDADEQELLRRQPGARVEHVAGAGHSIQGDAPVDLARLIADFTG